MEMQIYENEEFGKVRTTTEENGAILFCGADVAKALGYAVPRKALFDHCKGVLKRNTLTSGGMQELSFITEADVYRLIFRSKLPSAERFEQWVVTTVLPGIRKTGAYITPQTLEQIIASPAFSAQFAQILKTEQDQNRDLQTAVARLEPKAYYFDNFVDTDNLISIRPFAKEVKLPERLLTFLLVEMKLAYRNSQHELMPTAFMVNSGFAVIKEWTKGKHSGLFMLFTPKGRLYVARRIEKRLAIKISDEI